MSGESKPAYSPGLEGVIAGESAICWVDPNAGLLYRGYDIHELARHTSFEEIAWLLLRGEPPEPWRTEALDCILALYADHEFNASTFSARVTASTMTDMYAAVTTALGTLKGPLHGGANEDSMRMLREVGSPDRAEAW